MPRNACRSLWDIPGAREFQKKYRTDLDAHGRVPRPCWKDRERRNGYSFRTDAYKFWKQILIPEATAQGLEDDDILIWLDGDVVTTAPISEAWLHNIIGNADLTYLGREPSHSELGFWAVRVSPRTREFLAAIANVYKTGEFVTLRETHSAFCFDWVRKKSNLEEHNLCRRGARGHVFPSTMLGPFLNHLKGPRKALGK